MRKEHVSRREYLFAAGAASVTGVAGCTSGGDNSTAGGGTAEASTGTGEPTGTESNTSTPVGDQTGETRVSSGETRLTVTEVVVTETLSAIGGYSNTTVSPEDGKQFVLVDVQARKQTENGTVPARTDYRLAVESASYSIDNIDVERFSRPVNASLYQVGGGFSGPEIGSTTRGWLVFEIPADTSAGTLQVREMRTQDDEPVTWDLQFGDAKTVTFTEEIQLPEKTAVATTVEATVSVKNTGGRTGRYATVVTSDLLSDSRTLEYTLEAGETREEVLELAVDGYYQGNAGLSVGSTNTATMGIVAPEVQLGDTWTGPQGVEYTVSDLRLTQSPEFEGSYNTLEVGDEQQIAIARLTVTNSTTEQQDPPERWEEPLTIVTGDQTYTNIGGRSADDLQFTSPVDGAVYPRTVMGLAPGDKVSGFMPFYLPASVSRSDIEIRLSYSHTQGLGSDGNETRAIWTR